MNYTPTQLLVFEFDDLPPSLNGDAYITTKGKHRPGGILRMHWRERRIIADAWAWHIKEQANNQIRWPAGVLVKTCSLKYIVRAVRMMDYDNFVAGFKFLGDGLVKARVLLDDSPLVILTFIPVFERVEHYHQRGCRVEIEVLSTCVDLLEEKGEQS